MASSFWKVCGFAVHMKTGGLRFLNPETRFQKSVFSGSVRTVGQNDAIHVRFRKRAFSSGPPPNVHSLCGHKCNSSAGLCADNQQPFDYKFTIFQCCRHHFFPPPLSGQKHQLLQV